MDAAWAGPTRYASPLSRTGENPPYGILGGTVETSASFEARYAPPFYPTRAIVLPDLEHMIKK